MITRNALRAIALATTFLAPFASFAQTAAPAADGSAGPGFSGELGLGLIGAAGHNLNQAGRYNGLNTTGLDAYGEFELNWSAPWNSSSTRYYDFYGNNLVFQSGSDLGTGISSDNRWSQRVANPFVNNGSIGFTAGDQGSWSAGLTYDSITYTGNVIDSLYNVTGPMATLNPGLTAFGGATATKAGAITSYTIPTLTATGGMLPFQTGTRRDILGANFKFIYGDWTFTGAFHHEHKEGSMEEAFDGPYGGTAFALPIDYDTDRYDASAAYNTRLFQGVFQYTFSHFTDNNTFVNLPYPTSNTAAPFQRAAAYSTPPSNDAHYFTFMGATNIIPFTRINVNARVGLEQQDATFAPNTGDPVPPAAALGVGLLNPNSLVGTTAPSLDAVATIYQLKISAASHPFANFDTRVYYGLDGRSVNLNQYRVTVGGTGGASDSTLTGLSYVVPQDWLKQNAGAEVGYRIIPQYDTKLTLGYRLDAIDRSNAQVGHSWTNTGSIGLSSAIGPQITGKISFDYADRSGNLSYLTPWENLIVGPGGTPTAPTYSGAFYQAPMTSEAITARASYTPMDNLNGDIFLQFKNENYSYPGGASLFAGGATAATLPITGTGQGIKQDYALSVGPDIDWRPTANTNLHFFYTYELLFFNNTGNGACSDVAQAATAACAGTIGYFQNKDTTSTHTVGVSGEWKVNEKLTLRGDYTVSYGSVMFGEYNGVFIPNPTASYQNVSNYPDIDSLMNSVKLTATYQLMPNVKLVLQGVYTSFHNNDWNDTANAIQGAGTTAISLLTPGYPAPNYSVGMLLAGMKVRF